MTLNIEKQLTSTRFSLRWKLLVGFTLIFSVVFASAYYWFYTFSSQFALNQVKEGMVNTLRAAVAGVNGDEFETLAGETSVDASGVPSSDPLYQKHQSWMETLHNIEPRAIPYSYIKGSGPNEVLWVGDILRSIRPDSATKFLEPYTAQGQLYQGLSAETIKLENPYTDEWGYWVSAYAPIKNSRGEIVGAIGVDFNASYVQQVQDSIKDSMLYAFMITYSVLFISVWLLSNLVTKPITTLTLAAERIGEGDYKQSIVTPKSNRFSDEISVLSAVFVIMVNKVYQRELNLIQKLETLRIEIDEVKRKKQVEDIVDTDFFRELQEKAQKIRQKAGKA